MSLFNWNEDFETGLPAIDAQHRHLVDLLNRFGDHISRDDPSPEEVSSVLSDLADYAVYHFREEEALMGAQGVDDRHRIPHEGEHASFIREVSARIEGFDIDDPLSADRLIKYLVCWLVYHILGSDQYMARQIAAIRDGSSASQAFGSAERKKEKSVDTLLEAMHGLFEQVSHRNRELEELNRTLESKVIDRTRALTEANEKLETLSLTDPLTGLPNRRHAMRKLASSFNEAIVSHSALACLMIDVDHFKEVNDQGGAERVGGKILSAVSRLAVVAGDGVWNGSVSIGVAAIGEHIDNIDALLGKADASLYAAKKSGRNCVRSGA